ncbi:type II secretion system protein [Anaerostipes sp.]|uniref:type II secretion system protein n=1 Tax=Anaerostipes sp. TaxID=1872530 RepID=UPI0025BC683F|nr:type II secretion system protein [Anaerostipes sp.]MBS7009304.1 type II secretion system protein [Anaerostipes sp.]
MKNRLKDNRGYTLIELMAVLVIFAILLAIAGGGIAAYQKHSAFKKNNEYAQTIFTALQSSMAHAKAGGSLDELSKELTGSEYKENRLNGKMIDDGAPVPDDAKGMYYFFFQKDEKRSEYKGAKKTVYDMIAPYIYDADVLNASFCVEFDPAEGTALGVCYSDKAKSFYYGNTQPKGGEGSADISGRAKADRSKAVIGYYGVDSISSTPEPMEGSVFKDLKLVNKETLSVQWDLEDAYQASALSLAYDMKLYDASSNQLMCSFKINDLDKPDTILHEEGKEKELTLSCDVTFYDKDEKVTETKNDMKFMGYVSKEGKMILVLDAVDLEAASQVSEKVPDYDGTYSIRRLGFSGVPVYARMQASGTGYRPSQWEQTNTEHSYFAKEETKKDGTKIFDLNNARHLYNLRFEEKDAPDDTILYRQSDDIIWSGDKGLAAGGFLFDKTKQVPESGDDVSFPSIEKLNKTHTLQGMGENDKSYTVRSFSFGKKDQKTPAGLFEVNEGTVRGMVLEQISSEGTDYVGTICGINYGTLKNISVDKKSTVSGKEFVGGIAGSDITGKPLDTGEEKLILVGSMRTYESLKNSARVTGEKFVGGIVGYLNGTYIEDPQKPEAVRNLALTECENYGYVTGSRQCIGGIVGYSRLTSIEKCLSAPVLTEKEETELKETAKNDQLKGDFVGGIAGINDDGTITKCTTGKEKEKTFVTGRRYVGGISGFHMKIGDSGVIDSKLVMDGDGSSNYANVIGSQYVGGITGVNGSVQGSVSDILNKDIDLNNFIVKKEEYTSKAVLKNWTNRGLVTATQLFGGGITGLNTGMIQNCTSQMQTEETSKEEIHKLLLEYGSQGVQIGGIAGYNNGMIKNDQSTPATVYVCGDTYVGGITGYNEKNGKIRNFYEIKGYVYGKDSVGGVAGVQKGEEDLKGFQNLADITAETGDAGGICGTMASNTMVLDSGSSGNISSVYGNAGGISGSGEDMIIEGCIVRGGTISSEKNTAGGVMGMLSKGGIIRTSSVMPGVLVQSPKQTAGGILGLSEKSASGEKTEIFGCSAAALLEAEKAGGIAGGADLTAGTMEIRQSRNYGFPVEKTKMSGIIGVKQGPAKNLKLQQCFGVSYLEYPLASEAFSEADILKCYYFTAADPDEERGIGVPLTVEKQGTAYFRAVGTDGGKNVTISNFTVNPVKLTVTNLRNFYQSIDGTITGYYNGRN